MYQHPYVCPEQTLSTFVKPNHKEKQKSDSNSIQINWKIRLTACEVDTESESYFFLFQVHQFSFVQLPWIRPFIRIVKEETLLWVVNEVSRLGIAIKFRSRIFYYFSLTFHELPLGQEGASLWILNVSSWPNIAKRRGRCKRRYNGTRKTVIASTLSFGTLLTCLGCYRVR